MNRVPSARLTLDKSRNLNFDFLKAIGIICIVLAHTLSKEQKFLFQLRSFDVPLMVIVSGALFWLTSGQKNYSFWAYLKKRIPRLMIPVWVFLIFFFVISYLISLFNSKAYPFGFKEIFYSFTLLIGGIGYVWIIRVFLLIAFISPFIVSLRNKFQKLSLFLLTLVAIYCGYTSLLFLRSKISTREPIQSFTDFLVRRVGFNIFFDQIFVLLIPYGCLFAFGIVMTQISKKRLFLFSLAFLIIFTILALDYANEAGTFVLTQDYKYPPKLYYLSYSLFMSIWLYLAANYVCSDRLNFLKSFSLNKVIFFLSDSSLWIYLWHIFFLYYWKALAVKFSLNPKNLPEFAIVFFLSVLTIYLQKKIVSFLLKKFSLGKRLSNFLTIVLLK
jgi:fucose 4-O-acetylase-like acetyltransferase